MDVKTTIELDNRIVKLIEKLIKEKGIERLIDKIKADYLDT